MLEQLSLRLKLVLATGILFFLSLGYSSNLLTARSDLSFKSTHAHTYRAEPHAHALNTTAKRVAIIGAGASGSSAAWFLTRAADVVAARLGVDRHALLDEIVVFDKNEYIGGRTTTVYPHGDRGLRAIELGGSIFVEANRHLNKGAKRFGLKVVDPDFSDPGEAIWDGARFLFSTSTSNSWWSQWRDNLALLLRYGATSPQRTSAAVQAFLSRIANLYDPAWLAQHGAAASVDDFAERVLLGGEYTARRGDEWALNAVGVNQRWMGEMWEASTRVNYAMDMHDIHALGAIVSVATPGAKSIEGGNWRVFKGMLDEAKVTLRLNTPVVDIVPLAETNGTGALRFQVITKDGGDNGVFDQIFYAAPWYTRTPGGEDGTPLPTLQKHLTQPIQTTEYVRLHVTLLTTTRTGPDPVFFHLPPKTKLPLTILTTSATWRAHPDLPFPRPEFQSISWHGETSPGSGEYIVKIFSLAPPTDAWLYRLLGEKPSWVLRKEWDAYPALRPLPAYPPVEPIKGVQYLAALEPWVSTMETQTLSAREAVARVVSEWWNLGYGECQGGADAWDWSCEQ